MSVILSVLRLQLTKSKVLIILLILTMVASLVSSSFISHWILEYLAFGGTFFLTLFLTMAITTAMHEDAHVSKLHELDYTAEDFDAIRIGNVSFRIPDAKDMTPEEKFFVAAAPFLRVKQYLAEIISFLLFVILTGISPFPLTILFAFFTILIALSLFASFCALMVIKKGKYSGFCVTLSRNVTSRGDIDEIVAWNLLSTNNA